MEQELVVASIADREHAKYAAAAICREYTEKGVIPFSVTALMEIIAPHVAERVAEINAMKAQALASSAPLAERAQDAELDNAIYELAMNLGGTFANGEHWDYETVREATRRLNMPDPTEPHCLTCDRPESDCCCVENGGTY